ncbi:MAG: hypothetical protein HN350_19060 [Phycisphaerales bacterium]|jgi:hypothetical protein|nr:hypothetical protein [Phycisphaerales bacterium]
MNTKAKIALTVLVTICMLGTSLAHGAEPEAKPATGSNNFLGWTPFDKTSNKLSATVDYTFMTRLMDKGGDYYPESSASLFGVNVNLFDTGFGVAVGQRMANGGEHVQRQRLDYKVYYGDSIFDDTMFQTDFSVAWIYHHNYRQSTDNGNTQEYELNLAWKNLLPFGITPHYQACYETPSNSGQGNRSAAGWWHVFGVGYDLELPGLLPNQDKQVLNFDASIAYRDGLGGGAVDHDWSHATVGVSTEFKITEGLSIVPGVYYQISMDDSVNDEDQAYGSISVRYKF